MLDLSTLLDKLSVDIIVKIAVVFCSGALLSPVKKFWHTISPLFLQPFSLTGIWIGICKMPDYEAVEIYRIVMHKERAALSFFSFCPDGSVRRFVGSGIFRGKWFSAFYHSPKAENHVSGVLSLQLGTAG